MSGLKEPLSPAEARSLLRVIITGGNLGFSSHALDEMEQDGLTEVEVRSVLRSGVVEPAEFERGSWRHRVRTQRICVVATFRSEVDAIVVTAWRLK